MDRRTFNTALIGIADDGRLSIARKYDVELVGKFQWWTGLVGLRAA